MVSTLKRSRRRVPAWHAKLLAMLAAIKKHAKIAFRHLDPEARQEAVQEVVCNACCAVARLAELDKLDLAYPTVLARCAVAQVHDGRKVGCKLNVRDVLSPHCQKRKDINVARLDRFDADEGCWIEILVEDHRSGPAETAAARIDFGTWMETLHPRDREIAGALGVGERTKEVSRRFDLSEGRISQKRREYHASWRASQGETPARAS